MKKYTEIEQLTNDSIRVTDGMIAVWPQFSKEEAISKVSEIVPKFPGRYAVNNSTVAFVHDGGFYVTPYTRSAITVLSVNGFLQEHFYVPFSNWDYPKFEQCKWEALQENARQSHKADFVSDCEAYCDEHHISAIKEETLANCFEMPENGVRVKHICYENTYYPVVRQTVLDAANNTKLGTYCCNNGRVVFVYRNGKTYVAKGYKILTELNIAGYKKADIFVPFSNGEEILDVGYKTMWDAITKN